MEKIITHLRHLDHEPTNMKEFFNILTVFITSLNIGFAMITAENINIITGAVGLGFLFLRNIPFVAVRGWELYLFIFKKEHRSKVLMIWRDAAKKNLSDENDENDDPKK